MATTMNTDLMTDREKRFFNTSLQVEVLKGYLNYYKTHKEYTKEQLYKDYYDSSWETFFQKKTLDKYLEVA